MSDTKRKEEAGQDTHSAVEESQQLVDAQVKPEALGAHVPAVEASNHVENEKVQESAEDKIVESRCNSEGTEQQHDQDREKHTLCSVVVEDSTQVVNKNVGENVLDVKVEAGKLPQSENEDIENAANVCHNDVSVVQMAVMVKPEASGVVNGRTCNDGDSMPSSHNESITPQAAPADTKAEINNGVEIENGDNQMKAAVAPASNGNSVSKNLSFLDPDYSYDGNESGTDEEQSAFMKELESFFKERSMEFKPPKFYGEGLNCLKLWRAVVRLGGYDKVTTCKLWRQVGESFKPPKTCTTVSWTFRGFYEKALLDYERHKVNGGELNIPTASQPEPTNIENQPLLPDKPVQASASGRARRDAAARAMQGWHSQRLLGNGEISEPIIKDRNALSNQKREKQLTGNSSLKRKKPSYLDNAVKAARSKPSKPQLDTSVVDIGPPADWVKVNVQKTKDCFEVYALVPGLLREEVRVQSDPAGRLVISGEPENLDNPWGVTAFKKVVSLPSRIDPHQTSAVVTLHGQLFVRVPFEQPE